MRFKIISVKIVLISSCVIMYNFEYGMCICSDCIGKWVLGWVIVVGWKCVKINNNYVIVVWWIINV